ncbi:hypothetical protein ACS0TY_013904 [Phlomoides rotata]
MEVEDDVITSETPITQSSRTSRDPTHMHRLAMLKNNEKKLVVFNDRGQPIGKNETEMQSYIGVLARKNIKIAYREWKDVPMSDKETIWEGVNDLDVHDMNTPPTLYRFITKDDWTDFVYTHMYDDFKELSEKQKSIRAQRKYPHRLSRKGYANYAVENTELFFGWKDERTNKGNMEEMSYKRQFQRFVSQYYGVKDGILAKALDSKEHAGRVRGIGGDVTTSTFFRNPKLNSGLLERIEKLESTVYKTRASNNTVEKGDESPIENGSYSVHFDGVVQDDEEDLKAAGDEEDLKAVDEEDLKAADEEDLKATCDDDEMLCETDKNLLKQGNKKCRKEKTLGHSRMSGKLHMLYCYAKVALSERVIRITMDKDVFGRELKIPIHFEDVDIFCRLHPISYSCIPVYIWHLYNKFKHKNFEKFRFVDPYGVGHVPSTNNEQTFIDAQISRMARVLTNTLVGKPANQLCGVSCNTGALKMFNAETMANKPKKELRYGKSSRFLSSLI